MGNHGSHPTHNSAGSSKRFRTTMPFFEAICAMALWPTEQRKRRPAFPWKQRSCVRPCWSIIGIDVRLRPTAGITMARFIPPFSVNPLTRLLQRRQFQALERNERSSFSWAGCFFAAPAARRNDFGLGVTSTRPRGPMEGVGQLRRGIT